ncbi:unnamed protein product [Malus baccata var. baccata]
MKLMRYDKYVVGEVADDGGVEGGARERFQQEDCDGAVLGDLEEVPSLGRATIGWDGTGRDGWSAVGANGSEEDGYDGSREEPGAEGCKDCIEGEVAHGFRGLEQLCSPRFGAVDEVIVAVAEEHLHQRQEWEVRIVDKSERGGCHKSLAQPYERHLFL